MYLLYILLVTVPTVLSGTCTFDVSFSPKSPFIALENYALAANFTFEEEDTFFIACPKNTYSPYLAEKGDRFVCKNNTSILNVRTVEIIDFKDIVCNEALGTTIRRVNESCVSNGTLVELGMEVYRDFIPVISCCFNEDKLMAVYCQGKMFNYSDQHELQECSYDETTFRLTCTFFDSGNLYSGIVMDDLYRNQLDIFANKGIEVTDVYVPFPLVVHPVLGFFDQIIESYPARDYINVVPFRNSTDFMSYVYLYEDNIYLKNTFVGTLGVASAKNKDSQLVELFLSDEKIPIPKWIWVMITANDVRNVWLFYNGVGNKKEAQEAALEVCDGNESVDDNLIMICDFDSIIDSVLKQIIENVVCPDLGC